jgi:hypothetical protein
MGGFSRESNGGINVGCDGGFHEFRLYQVKLALVFLQDGDDAAIGSFDCRPAMLNHEVRIARLVTHCRRDDTARQPG